MSNLNARPSATFIAPLNGAPQGATFDVGIYTDPEGVEHTVPVSTGITEYERTDNLSNYRASRTAPDTAGEFEVRWYDADSNLVGTDSLHVGYSTSTGFGTPDDVEARPPGRTLTTAERDAATQAIDTVAGLILEVAGTAEPDPVPAYYRALCIEKAASLLSNPDNVAAESLGQHSVTYSRNTPGIFLTDAEERTIRRIANGVVSGSTKTRALPHDVYVTEEA